MVRWLKGIEKGSSSELPELEVLEGVMETSVKWTEMKETMIRRN